MKDPRGVSLADKKALLDEYNQIIWSTSGAIHSSSISYGDGVRNVVFAGSNGTYIEQSKIDVTLNVRAMARDGGDVQQAGFSVGGNGDYSVVEGRHDEVRAETQRAVDFLSAPAAEGREYTVVLDPILAGVFVHEAFGHLSEADHVYENKNLRDIRSWASASAANTSTSSTAPPSPASGAASSTTTKASPPSRRTSSARASSSAGSTPARPRRAWASSPPATPAPSAISSPHRPMTNTYIEPQQTTFDEIVAEIDDGVYAKNWYGGMTSMEMFTFSAGEAYRIRNGRVEELLRPVVLSGNLFETLENIDAIGNDLEMNQGGGCGKGGQSPLAVSNGSPHIRIRNCLVGGK